MNNYEFYKKEIEALHREGKKVAVYADTGKVVDCGNAFCTKCVFSMRHKNSTSSCPDNKMLWAVAEHIDKPKLTKAERQFLELLTWKNLYIARDNVDCYDTLYMFDDKPRKEGEQWSGRFVTIEGVLRRTDARFDFIKGTDEEPWAVEDLLKLEVMDE